MPKRKRIVLTMKDKYEIIKRLEEGESATKLSNEYNVGKSTITDIKKQKASISNFISQFDSSDGSTNRKTMKLASNTDLDDAVYKWFTQKKSQGEFISGPILCEKAVQFNKKLGGPSNFQASTGWLKRFKSRHGIHKLQMQGEKLSADSSAAEFKIKLRDILKEENDPLEIFHNTDETGLNRKALPQKTLASGREFAAPGTKISINRISAVACANATSSHRLPLLVIGKSKKPRCFTHDNMFAMPIVLASSTASSDNEDENIIGASEAFTCLDIALRWFETQAESDQFQISVLKEIRELAARKRGGLLRQTKIEDFFKRYVR